MFKKSKLSKKVKVKKKFRQLVKVRYSFYEKLEFSFKIPLN